jgi:hypothetical protein
MTVVDVSQYLFVVVRCIPPSQMCCRRLSFVPAFTGLAVGTSRSASPTFPAVRMFNTLLATFSATHLLGAS